MYILILHLDTGTNHQLVNCVIGVWENKMCDSLLHWCEVLCTAVEWCSYSWPFMAYAVTEFNALPTMTLMWDASWSLSEQDLLYPRKFDSFFSTGKKEHSGNSFALLTIFFLILYFGQLPKAQWCHKDVTEGLVCMVSSWLIDLILPTVKVRTWHVWGLWHVFRDKKKTIRWTFHAHWLETERKPNDGLSC